MADERIVGSVKLVDATTTSQTQTVDANGDAGVILAANSGVDIGDVDVTSSSGQAAEAAALPAVFVVIAGDDGTDTHPIQVDASGNLKAVLASNTGVDIGDVDVLTLPGEGVDDAAYAGGQAILPSGMVFDDAAPDPVDEGDIGYQRMNSTRAAHMVIRDDAGNERGMNVDATGNASVILASNTGVDIGDVDVLSGPTGASAFEVQGTAADGASQVGDPVVIAGNDATNVQTIRTDTDGHLQVDILTGAGSDVPTNPTMDTATSAAVAAGATVDLDSAEVTEAEKLWQVVVSSSVPFKVIIRMVEDAIDNPDFIVLFGGPGNPVIWAPPHKDFFTHAGAAAGLDVFQAEFTNLDSSEAADAYASFLYST